MSNLSTIRKLMLASLMLSYVCLLAPSSSAQDRNSQQSQLQLDNDNISSQAAELVFSAGLEATSLKVPGEKIEAQLEAARILLKINRDASLRLVNAAWDSLNSWAENSRKSRRQLPPFFSQLRSKTLDLYFKLDPAKANRLAASLSESDSDSKDKEDSEATKPKGRQKADELVKVALTTINSDPDKAIEVALSGLTLTDKISENLGLVSQALKDRPALLQKFENALAQMLMYKSSIDGDDFRAVAGLITADPQMTRAAQLTFLNFLLRSTEQLAAIARDAGLNGKPVQLSEDAVDHVYFVLTYFVRKVFLTYQSERLPELDKNLEEIRGIVSRSMQDMVYAGTTSDSLEVQLKRASSGPNGTLRDRRLTRFTFRALSGKTPNIELASDAITEISDPETKAILSDYLLMSRIMVSAANKDFEVAEKRTREISKNEWRAWAFMALGTAKAEQSQADATRLYTEALQFLNKSSPSPLKVDLTFILAEMWGAYDLHKASEVVLQAIKTSNQNMSNSDATTSAALDLNGFFPRIGKLNFAPGMPVSSLADVTLPPVIGRLAGEDWTQALQNAQAIEYLSLRIRYKLAISKAVLDKPKTEKKVVRTN